jgi:hypothetical protein
MQELIHDDVKKDYTKELEKLRQQDPGITGIQITVAEDYKKSAVVLSIGAQAPVYFTEHQARDLALHLRQAANRVQRERRGR